MFERNVLRRIFRATSICNDGLWRKRYNHEHPDIVITIKLNTQRTDAEITEAEVHHSWTNGVAQDAEVLELRCWTEIICELNCSKRRLGCGVDDDDELTKLKFFSYKMAATQK